MGKKCLKCGYERKPSDIVPDYECPKCGAIYSKVEIANQTEEGYLPKLRDAIQKKDGISFRYSRADGHMTIHNAVYPREILRKGNYVFFRAYCHFTHDVRLFRLDRVQSLQLVQLTRNKRYSALRERLISIIVILVIPVSYMIWTFTGGDPRGQWVLVTHVTDGDTIGVGRGWRYGKVRLVGVNTPETVHPEKPVEFFGPESSSFTKSQLLGKRVHLQFESGNQYDHYGRMLAYVFVDDGTLFNAELVKHGYARVTDFFPFQYYEEFKRYEREAKKNGVGMWSRQ